MEHLRIQNFTLFHFSGHYNYTKEIYTYTPNNICLYIYIYIYIYILGVSVMLILPVATVKDPNYTSET